VELTAWQIFLALGLFCLTAEIFSLSFYLAPIGTAALITSLFSLWITSLAWQIVFFCLVSVALYLSLGKLARKHFNAKTNLSGVGLEKQTGTLIKTCESGHSPGKVRLYGDTWEVFWDDSNAEYISAIRAIPEGARVRVIRVDGNRVVIEPVQ
jgi:membrane protein implicated in regulation of membrane protease activity